MTEPSDLDLTTASGGFQLVSPYQPAGDQPQAIEKLVAGFQNGVAKQVLLGVTGSGKTYTIANMIQQVQKPTLVMAHNKTLAAQLYGEFRAFFPHNAVEYFVSYYDYYQPEAYVPSSDTYIEKDSSINDHIEQMRLAATKALLSRRDTIVVATVSAIYGLGAPEDYLSMRLILSRGERIDQRELLRHLTTLQYTRNEYELQRGTFRVRGEVVDVHPAESDAEAVRIELFDGEIENIALFDPLAQRQDQTQRQVVLRRTQPVDRRHGGDHQRIGPGQQRLGGGQPHLLDVLVDRAVLLDEGIAGRHVGFRLVIVVVADEIFDRIVRKECLELAVQLRRQRLVGRHHEGGLLDLLHHVGDRVGLARARHAQQRLLGQARLEVLHQLLDGAGLVARGRIRGNKLETIGHRGPSGSRPLSIAPGM